MVERERTDWEIIVLSVIATVLIMSGVYFIGIQLNDHKVHSIESEVQNIEAEHQSQIIGQQLAEDAAEGNCESMKNWRDHSFPEMEELRREVQSYEQSNKFDHSDYETVKTRYTNMVLQNMLEARSIEENCNETMGEVIYIYTQDCEPCEDQGTVLSYFRRNTDNTYVYPLDSDLNMQPVNFLEEHYDIDHYPAMIVEGELYQGFKDREEFGEILEDEIGEEL